MGWHVPAETVRRFLERVGVSESLLKLIPEIVQTCRVCREWSKPTPDHICSAEVADIAAPGPIVWMRWKGETKGYADAV